METPVVLTSHYERELDRLLRLIEAGGAWPAAGSDENALLRRAMRPNKIDRKDWVVARVARCRPDKLVRSRADRTARIERYISDIEKGGNWPPPGSADRVALVQYVTPGSRLFRQEVFDRIGKLAPGPSPRRATAAEIEATVEAIVSRVEQTGIVPRATDPEGRLLRSWLRPSDPSFKPAVWLRLESSQPGLLDRAALAEEKAKIAATVDAVVSGGPWPSRRSVPGMHLARVLDADGFFHSSDLVARLEAAAPNEVGLARKMRGRGGDVGKKKGGS